jgi:hypothetical protein
MGEGGKYRCLDCTKMCVCRILRGRVLRHERVQRKKNECAPKKRFMADTDTHRKTKKNAHQFIEKKQCFFYVALSVPVFLIIISSSFFFPLVHWWYFSSMFPFSYSFRILLLRFFHHFCAYGIFSLCVYVV